MTFKPVSFFYGRLVHCHGTVASFGRQIEGRWKLISKTNRKAKRLMDNLTWFGLVAVTAMLIFYALEDRSPWFILAFAGACALGSIYGFLQGAWPFGVIEAIWAGIAAWRWSKRSS